MSGLGRPTATGWPQLCATSSLSNPRDVHNRTELHSWTLEHHSWLHQGAHKQSVSCSSSLSCSTYTRAVVVSYSEYVLVTQIPQKFGRFFDSHGSLQTHLRTMVYMTRKMLIMLLMKVKATMTMFSSVWKVLSQQSRLGSSQQLLMVPIHLHLHNHTHLHPCTPTHSRTLTHMHTYALTHTLTHICTSTYHGTENNICSHTQAYLYVSSITLFVVILLTYTLSHWSSYTPTFFF